MAGRMKRYRMSDMTDEQVVELMDSIASYDEIDFSSSDEDEDPTYLPDIFTSNHDISNCIEEMEAAETSAAFLEDISTTFDVSAAEKVAESFTVTSSSKTPKRVRSPLSEIEENGPIVEVSSGGFDRSNLTDIKRDSSELSKILWRKNSLLYHVNEIAFRGDSKLPESIANMKTPLEIFTYFFDNEINEMIVTETNHAAHVENINSTFSISTDELRQYVGILMYMSVYRYPNLDSYWRKNSFAAIQKTMPLKKFMEIKKYLCFHDETKRIKKGQQGYDALFRIRNLANKFNERFDSVPKMPRLCVDEQMCSTKMKHHLRQYMPNKPHKWGIKLFVLCDSFGYAYKFEIYIGAGDNIVLPNTPDLGSCANVVVRLTQTVPEFKHHIVYFDNFYTTLPLLAFLRAKGIYSLGTIRANRIPNCKLPSDNEIKDKARGYSVEYTSSLFGVGINNVLWKDNKCVRLASTYVGIERFQKEVETQPRAKASRYDWKKKNYLEIDCPQIIREYNSHMGGVDLLDGLMGRYHIRVKTRNPMMRIFYHLIDLAATNAYLLYRRISNENNIKDVLQLPKFREEIAAGLVTYNKRRTPGRQRSNTPLQPKSIVGKNAQHPVPDVRFDRFDHFPVWLDRKGGKKRCKYCKTSDTQCFCQKCELHLCCTQSKNCFLDYHHPKL